MIGVESLVTRSVAEEPVSVVGSSARRLGCSGVLGKTIGASRMANEPRPKVVASRIFGSPGWASARPVVGSMLPTARSRSVTSATGRNPPSRGEPSKAMLGNSVQVAPLSSER